MKLAEQRKKMDARCIKVIKMREEGMIYKDIGEYFGVSKDRARQMFFRGNRVILTRERAKDNPIEGLSCRAFSVLKNEGIANVSQLKGVTAERLLSWPNCGQTSVDEIMALIPKD